MLRAALPTRAQQAQRAQKTQRTQRAQQAQRAQRAQPKASQVQNRAMVRSRGAVFFGELRYASLDLFDKKSTAPHTRADVRGGCSPQNNLRKLEPY